MEEPHDRERSRRDYMTPRRTVHFREVLDDEPGEELRTALDKTHNLPEMAEDLRLGGYRRRSSIASAGTDLEYN
eukprot:3780524-Rhodomonas_salina.1